MTVPVRVDKAYLWSKDNGVSFFCRYLHDCMKAVNETDELRYRILDETIVDYDVIHASATFLRADETFGFSYIHFDSDFDKFYANFRSEQQRIENGDTLYPPENDINCIHCSALPWLKFSSHKEPRSYGQDSVPKIAFSKTYKAGDELMMNVAISANHALVDGIHVGRFIDRYQDHLDRIN